MAIVENKKYDAALTLAKVMQETLSSTKRNNNEPSLR